MKWIVRLTAASAIMGASIAIAEEQVVLPPPPPPAPTSDNVLEKILKSPVLPGKVVGGIIPGQESPANPSQAPSPSGYGVILKKSF